MKTIGMIGSQLIHTYAYAMHFRKPDLAFAKQAKTVPAWQLAMMESHADLAPLAGIDFACVAGGLEGVPEDMAGTFGLHVLDSTDAVIDACDLVMVMDEQTGSRSQLVRKALEAGKPVFADKVLSISAAETEELVALAGAKGVQVAAWSQQGYCPEYDRLKELPEGGMALVSFRMSPEILRKYGIHLISTLQGCFPGPYQSVRALESGDDLRMIQVLSAAGTRVIAVAGEHVPAGMSRVDYMVNGKAVVIETTDRVGAFRRAAEDIVGMLDGKTPRFGRTDLMDASRLVELIGSRS